MSRSELFRELEQNLIHDLNESDESVGLYMVDDLTEVFGGDHGFDGIDVLSVSNDTVTFRYAGYVFEVYWNSYLVDDNEYEGLWALR